MRIFISWSGHRSEMVATALRDWLPLVLHYAQPWLSQRDIIAGDRWMVEVGKELETSQFGILVLTRENLLAPWILFEAGAVSKMLDYSLLCPYLVGVDYHDLPSPLAQFQSKKAEKAPTLQIVQAINARALQPVDDNRLAKLFELTWPQLQGVIKTLPGSIDDPVQGPSPEAQRLDVITESVRSIQSAVAALTAKPTAEPHDGITRYDERRVLEALRQIQMQVATLTARVGQKLEDIERAYAIRPVLVELRVNSRFPKLANVPAVTFSVRDNIVANVAEIAGVSASEYGREWYLIDAVTERPLIPEEADRILARLVEGPLKLEIAKVRQ